jgi:hypothetical protein
LYKKTNKEKIMKTNTIMNIAIVAGMLSFGVLSASAADSFVSETNSTPSFDSAAEPFSSSLHKQAIQKFVQETATLASALKAKEIELSEQTVYTVSESNSVPGFDDGKTSRLESEIKELEDRIKAAAQKYGVSAYYYHS